MNDLRRPARSGFHPGTKILMCIAGLCFTALCVLLGLGGNQNLFLHFWVYPALAVLGIGALAALLIPVARKFIQAKTVKNIVSIILGIVIGYLLVIGGSFVWVIYEAGERPIKTFTDEKNEHKVVIMRRMTLEDGAETTEDAGAAYKAYLMVNSLFYRHQDEGEYLDPEGEDAEITAEWLENKAVIHFNGEATIDVLYEAPVVKETGD